MTTLHVSKLRGAASTTNANADVSRAHRRSRPCGVHVAHFCSGCRWPDRRKTIVRAIFERLDGCVLTTLEVLVVDERESVPPGGPVTGARIEAGIEQLDECSHEFLSSAFVIDALTDEEFHIDNKLESASVTKTVEMIDDILGTSFPVTIDLTWTATGPATRGRDRSFIRFEDEMFHSTEKFIVRDATASGSVVSGTTDFLDTLSLAGADLVTRAVRFVGVVT